LIKWMERRSLIQRRADDLEDIVLETRMNVYAQDTQ
jgi:hypothetical protein